ncbi:MAG: serine/threonine protein kinase [Phycisphaerales bacterium]|nr:serine/threonine protein kinase [Phycisphaerales bacterium]
MLMQRCDRDDELRCEVESLLANRKDGDSLFNDQLKSRVISGANSDTSDVVDWVGRRLGPYRLKRLLSTGGMGVVFLAEQDRPRRNVAIKLLHRGLFLQRAQKRFAFEAEILGRLRHPCIAEIFEAGQAKLTPPPERGPAASMHYFAMEYIEGGQTMIDYAAVNELSVQERLSLFVRVCDGVQHGHLKGVIHRDLKPSNILVTTDEQASGEKIPLPKIIDFGVAKCTDGDIAVTTMQTGTGELIGTLQYMSPEQCGADPLAVDTRADVYALGVILYQLLTERVPYDVSNLTIQAAVRVITEEEAAPASRFDQNLRGDVETVIAKAMEKDPERRYGSVAEMSRDVQRYLGGEPIGARKPTRWMRAMRWITRHPRWTATIGGISISATIVFATMFIIWQAGRIPYRVELTTRGNRDDPRTGLPTRHGDRAALYAMSGEELAAWTADEDGIYLLEIVDRPKGTGRAVVVGFSKYANEPAFRNNICVFDASAPNAEPLMIALEPEAVEQMPDDAWPRPEREQGRTYSAGQFVLQGAWMHDVFVDSAHPGKEIIAFHLFDGGSQGVLCIYDIDGDTLFRVWQDGGIND